MALRPVFIPVYHGPRLVEERPLSIPWASGFSATQKKKNVASLHHAAQENGLKRILEISSKSEKKVGRRLSAFSLKIDIGTTQYPLESVYQGCKVFGHHGPATHIFTLSPREAKRYMWPRNRDTLVGFCLSGKFYPASPKNAFYDWLYIRSLEKYADWIKDTVRYDAFTDIEFNPAKQVNCQARAFAEYVSLLSRGHLTEVAQDFDLFVALLRAASQTQDETDAPRAQRSDEPCLFDGHRKPQKDNVMSAHKHDWRTQDFTYVQEDTALSNPDRYEWSEPTRDDQSIITRGIARQGARVDIMVSKAVIKLGAGELLDIMIKEPNPTAIFLNESRSAWERRRNLLAEESASIRQTGQFSIDTKGFDFLQASQSAVIMAMTALECYVNHKLQTERKSRQSIITKVNESLPERTGRKKLSANPATTALWKKFQAMKKLRDHLVHATAKKMERVNIHRPEWVNAWEHVAQIDCPHDTVLQLIAYFEDGQPLWCERFPRYEDRTAQGS